MPFKILFKICAWIGWEKKHQGLAKKEKPKKDKIPTVVLFNCSLCAGTVPMWGALCPVVSRMERCESP